MRVVSRFESNLLRILYWIVGEAPITRVMPLLLTPQQRPPCLTRDTVRLVERALAKGTVTYLCRSGGWRNERFIRGEDVVTGRVWERSSTAGRSLDFSPASLEFLIWLTSAEISAVEKGCPLPSSDQMTMGDQLLLFMTMRALRGTEIAGRLLRHSAFARHGLVSLVLTEHFGDPHVSLDPDLSRWMRSDNSFVLESLQDELVASWLQLERDKQRVESCEQMRRIGQNQSRVLNRLFEAAETANRRDLCRFLLIVCQHLLTPAARPQDWIASLQVAGLRLAERTDSYRAAGEMLRQVERLQDWQTAATNTGFLDEGYAASQLWKSDWEGFNGEECGRRANAVFRELGGFGISAPPSEGAS